MFQLCCKLHFTQVSAGRKLLQQYAETMVLILRPFLKTVVETLVNAIFATQSTLV